MSNSWFPKNINVFESIEILDSIHPQIAQEYSIQVSNGWKFWVVNSKRGMCYHSHKTITIPLWVVKIDRSGKSPGYKSQYLAHELAHINSPWDSHGPKFMTELIRICPKNLLHYELNYKPKNAAAAGISRKDSQDSILLFPL